MGKAFVFGDNISTDLIAPGHLLKKAPEVLAQHCLTAADPNFVQDVSQGDILVAGENFGQGSSREQAVESLKIVGISVVLAKSFARIFYRNAFNLGLPAIFFSEADEIAAGDDVAIDLNAGIVTNVTKNRHYNIHPLPPHLRGMIEAGGLLPQLETRFSSVSGKRS